MPEPGTSLSPELQRKAFVRLTEWRRAPDGRVGCPVCEVPGLRVTDRSARPYAEWYQLECGSCGLDHTFQMPAPRPPIVD